MDEKELQKIQDEIMSEIDKEQKTDKEITASSEEIASHLLMKKKVNAEINDTVYMINYRLLESKTGKKVIYLVIANVNKYKIVGEKYIPFTAFADMDTRYSEYDNLKTVVEGFIRHVSDKIKPEMLEE